MFSVRVFGEKVNVAILCCAWHGKDWGRRRAGVISLECLAIPIPMGKKHVSNQGSH